MFSRYLEGNVMYDVTPWRNDFHKHVLKLLVYYSDLGVGRVSSWGWGCGYVYWCAYWHIVCFYVYVYVIMWTCVGVHVCVYTCLCEGQTLMSNVFLNHPMLMFLFPKIGSLYGSGSSPTMLNQQPSFKIFLLLLPNCGDTDVHPPTLFMHAGDLISSPYSHTVSN